MEPKTKFVTGKQGTYLVTKKKRMIKERAEMKTN
jgi:hypothetical protein